MHLWPHLFLYAISARQTSKLTEFKRPSTSLPFNKLWHIPPPHRGRLLCLGVKIRIEGQVLSQAARLISSVHRQPARKTLKSVMLTSCNTGDTVQTEEGAVGGEWRERGSGDWDRAGGMERNVDKKKNSKYIQRGLKRRPYSPVSARRLY